MKRPAVVMKMVCACSPFHIPNLDINKVPTYQDIRVVGCEIQASNSAAVPSKSFIRLLGQSCSRIGWPYSNGRILGSCACQVFSIFRKGQMNNTGTVAYQASYPSTTVADRQQVWGRLGPACQKGTTRGEFQGSRPILPQIDFCFRPRRRHSHTIRPIRVQLFVQAIHTLFQVLLSCTNGRIKSEIDRGSIAFLGRIILESLALFTGDGAHDKNGRNQ